MLVFSPSKKKVSIHLVPTCRVYYQTLSQTHFETRIVTSMHTVRWQLSLFHIHFYTLYPLTIFPHSHIVHNGNLLSPRWGFSIKIFNQLAKLLQAPSIGCAFLLCWSVWARTKNSSCRKHRIKARTPWRPLWRQDSTSGRLRSNKTKQPLKQTNWGQAVFF